jgi:hypothetical protein
LTAVGRSVTLIRLTRFEGIALARLLVVLLVAAVAAACGADRSDSEPVWTLARLKATTDKYRDVARAKADGYTFAGDDCVEGAGIHYVNRRLLRTGALDPAKPEALMYVKRRGSLVLVAIEYMAYDRGQPRPRVLGRPLDGPISVLVLPEPFYFEHVWLFLRNSRGVFAPLNPAVRC